MTLVNTILWDDTAPVGPEVTLRSENTPSSLTLDYSDVERGQDSIHVDNGSILNWGEGMIDTDPLFADSLYHL